VLLGNIKDPNHNRKFTACIADVQRLISSGFENSFFRLQQERKKTQSQESEAESDTVLQRIVCI
jgi:hypothetical protein